VANEWSIPPPDAVLNGFREAFAHVISNLAESRGVSVPSEVSERAQEAILRIFEGNPARVQREFKELKVGKASAADVGFSIAVTFSFLILTNALYEGRKKVTMGDVYLSLIDVEKSNPWPWR
jgi:hypothetical protein